MWHSIKVIFSVSLCVMLFKLRKNEKVQSNLKTLRLLIAILVITSICDIMYATPLIAKKTEDFRLHPVLNIGICLADLALIPVMSWAIL